MKLKSCLVFIYLLYILQVPSLSLIKPLGTFKPGDSASGGNPAASPAVPGEAPSTLPVLGPGVIHPIQPDYLDVVLYNPFSGFTPRVEAEPELANNMLYFEYLLWRDIEPSEGFIDIQHILSLIQLDAANNKDAKVIIRVVLDYPREKDHIDIPDWVYESIQGDGIHYDNAFGKGFSPNYENKELIALHRNMIERLSEALHVYDIVALVELGSVGHWGEWHIHSDVNKKMRFPQAIVYNQYIQPYIDYFPDTFLSIRRPLSLPKRERFALFHDSIGDYEQTYDFFLNWVKNGYTWWLNNEPLPAMPEYWRNGPSGGESVVGWATMLSDENYESTFSEVKDLHLSYWKTSTKSLKDEKLQERFETLQKLIGYRYVIRNVALSEKNKQRTLTVSIENTGAAPFYLNWPFTVSLVDENNHVRYEKLLDGTPASIMPDKLMRVDFPSDFPSTIEAGEYRICLSVADPKTGLPAIQFPHPSITGQYRYPIGTLIK